MSYIEVSYNTKKKTMKLNILNVNFANSTTLGVLKSSLNLWMCLWKFTNSDCDLQESDDCNAGSD